MKYLILILGLFVWAVLPEMVLAASCTPGVSTTSLCNPLSLGGDIRTVVSNLIATVGVLFGTVAILMVVLSGARMLISQGDTDQLKKGKEGLKYSVIGFSLAMLSFVIVSGIQRFLRASDVAETSTDLINPLADSTFQGFVINTLLPNFFAILGLIALVMIIISGFRYLTSAGNEDQVKKGKEGLQWSVIGLMVVLLAYVIINALEGLLRS